MNAIDVSGWFIALILLIVLIIGLWLFFYFELPRYFRMVNDPPLYKLDRDYRQLPRVKVKGRVIITLTSIPDRLNKLDSTLASLLDQSERVDEIRLNLPRESLKGVPYHLPARFEKLKQVRICWLDRDWGPSTKLLPSIKDEPDAHFIVVDDDRIYGSRFVECLTRTYVEHGCRKVVTNYGLYLGEEDWFISRPFRQLNRAGRVDHLMGCAGFILCGRMMPPQAFDYDKAPDGAMFVDDNWFSGWLNQAGYKIIMPEHHSWSDAQGCYYMANYQDRETLALCTSENADRINFDRVDDWFVEMGAYDYIDV